MIITKHFLCTEIITDMKIGLCNIISLALLSILFTESLPYQQQCHNTTACLSNTGRYSGCNDLSTAGNSGASSTAENKTPCNSNGGAGCSCLQCLRNTLSPFTVPNAGGTVYIAIFQGITGKQRQNPDSYIKQPPVPPPLTYS